MGAMTASQGDIRAVSDARDPRRLPLAGRARGRVLRAGVGGGRGGAAGTAPRARRGSSACSPATGSRTRRSRSATRLGGAVRAGDRRGREGRPRVVRRRRRIRVPASSANLGPGFDVLAAALALHIEVEVVETGRFGVVTDLSIARDRRNLVVRGFAQPRAARRLRVPHHLRRPAVRRPRHERRRLSSPGCSPPTRSSSSTPTCSRSRPSSRAIPTTSPPRCTAASCCAPTADAERFDPPAGLEAVLVVPHRHVRTAKARAALPAEVPMADAVFNVAHASLLVLGLAQGRLDLVARGLADRLHQPRRAALYPESMALLARAPEFGALGASISGAGPTVLVWSQYDATAGVVERLRAEADGLGRRHARPVRAAGRGRARAHVAPRSHAEPSRRRAAASMRAVGRRSEIQATRSHAACCASPARCCSPWRRGRAGCRDLRRRRSRRQLLSTFAASRDRALGTDARPASTGRARDASPAGNRAEALLAPREPRARRAARRHRRRVAELPDDDRG